HAGDYFIEDEQDVMPIAELAQDSQVLRRWIDDAAGMSDRLDHDRCHRLRSFHLDDVADERRAGDVTLRVALPEGAAVTSRRKDVQKSWGQGLVDNPPSLQSGCGE